MFGKECVRQCLCENVYYLVFCFDIRHEDVVLKNSFTHEVVLQFYVLGPSMKHEVLCKLESALLLQRIRRSSSVGFDESDMSLIRGESEQVRLTMMVRRRGLRSNLRK